MTSEMFDLTGKVAIVTGSTKGIGRAMVEGLARAGASVVVSSRKQELCDHVAREIESATGADVLGLACHVGEWDAIPAFVDTVRERFGRIDVLVNNAGINPAHMSPSDMTLEFWRKVFSVNLEGPLRMSQCVAPVMRDGGGGSIVHIGTMAIYGPGPGICAYGASKAALKNLTRSMAMDWAPWKIRVNILSPGPFTSEMLLGAAKSDPGYLDMVAGGTLMQRVADLRRSSAPSSTWRVTPRPM
jgi:NAD(P)-dependent dehydrogenase (short-subunit alcohol dehydrogenase family)